MDEVRKVPILIAGGGISLRNAPTAKRAHDDYSPVDRLYGWQG